MKFVLAALLSYLLLDFAAALLGLPIIGIGSSDDPTEACENGEYIPLPEGSIKCLTFKDINSIKDLLNPRNIKTEFYFYTKRAVFPFPEVTIVTKVSLNNTAQLASASFNPDIPTRIIIHGYMNNHATEVNTVLRSGLFQSGQYNVISVDWSYNAGNLNYIESRYSIPYVGAKVAEFIDFLHRDGGMQFADLTVIGHSLGAHVAGCAGKEVTEGRIHTIIGLEPAAPLFLTADCTEKLCKSDAEYVESIHTNVGGFGLIGPVGHCSFYPHHGSFQPGCGLDLLGGCSHDRAFHYYADALVNKNYLSYKYICSANGLVDCQLESTSALRMGDPNNYGKTGEYYVPVNGFSPYGSGAQQSSW